MSAALEPDLDFLPGNAADPDVVNGIVGIRSQGCGDQLRFRQQTAGTSDDSATGRRFENLAAKEERAAADADGDHVDAKRQPHPKVNLEYRLPRPQALRVPPELVRELHLDLSRVSQARRRCLIKAAASECLPYISGS